MTTTVVKPPEVKFDKIEIIRPKVEKKVELSLDQFSRLKKLGKGKFGEVYLVR